ncbi:MAG: TetR/AcrR family transcriptional regulator [Intrasporangium sp.]|uniref:TetR/AcrR family transcriptional regulator n=1 Tax=Intrasporangium sp. TaxID=1925024 RepID=UPI002647AEAE|nr:TetR/AcrR family transcriptional regulator [Intrasporangium sp.]MDN5796289.1 TetR/AcrR family transcriptional regulator [Intrasporangium sp.]
MTELPRYLQLLWGREPEGRRGPKPGRTIEEIGAAAVAIADRDGLEAVSMKSVAQAVGFTTMSLYRYVDSKEELTAVMLDLAYGPPTFRYPRRSTWRKRITLWAKEIATVRLARPWSVELAQGGPPLTPNALSWTERGLEALAGTPLTSQERLSALLAIDVWGQNHVRLSTQMGLVGRSDPDRVEVSWFGLILRVVDKERFPHLLTAGAESLDDADEDFFEEEFERGLGLLLDGIAALIARQS